MTTYFRRLSVLFGALVFAFLLLYGGYKSVRAEEQAPLVPQVPQAVDIVGGDPAELGQFSFLAKITIGRQKQCDAFLLTPIWLATAAHCIPNNLVEEPISIEMGRVSIFSSTLTVQIRSAVQAIRHPDWDSAKFNNDYGLIRVDAPFELNEFVNTVELTDLENLSLEAAGAPVTVAGWGATSYGGGSSARVNFVEIEVIDQAMCAKTYEKLIDITPNMLCAGLEGKDSCQGDSGGPLIGKDKDGSWKAVGIVSFGVGCGVEPGVYSRISQMLDWFESYTGVIGEPNIITPTVGITWSLEVLSPVSLTVDVSDTVVVEFVITNTSELTHIVPVTMVALGFDPGLITFPVIIGPGESQVEHYVFAVTVAPPVLTIRADGTSKVIVFKKTPPPFFEWEIFFEGHKGSETLQVYFSAVVSQTAEVVLTMHNADPLGLSDIITDTPTLSFGINSISLNSYRADGKLASRCTLYLIVPPPMDGDWSYTLTCPVSSGDIITHVDIPLYVMDPLEAVIINASVLKQNQARDINKVFDWGVFLSSIYR